jgi:hypothetical protein
MRHFICQDCGTPAVWEVVVTVDETEHARDLCGPCYDTSAATLRAFAVPFVSRVQ